MGSKFDELPKKEMGSFWQFVLRTSSNYQIKTKTSRYTVEPLHNAQAEKGGSLFPA